MNYTCTARIIFCIAVLLLPDVLLAQTPAADVDSRLKIVSPENNQHFGPGDTVNITVKFAPSLMLAAGFIDAAVPGLGPLAVTNFSGNTYQASFTIPQNFAGPIVLTPAALDSKRNPIRGAPITINAVPSGTPLSLYIVNADKEVSSVPSKESISVMGQYQNNTSLDLATSVSGTTYTSSNPGILTVDANGNVNILALGTAVVTVQNSGLRAFATYDIEAPENPLPPQDDSAQMNISLSEPKLEQNTGRFIQTAQLTNSLPIPIIGPLYFVLADLPAGVSLDDKRRGETNNIQPQRSPYIELKLLDGLTLKPGASVSLILQFTNPRNVTISYHPKVFRKLGSP